MMDFVSRLFRLCTKKDEGGVVVFGIFDKKIASNDIHAIFSKYGLILSLNFLPHEQMCYIKFNSFQAAQNAIEDSTAYPVALQENVFEEGNENFPKSNLDIFNDYIMLNITKYVGIFERLRLSIAFPQFRYLLSHFAKGDLNLEDLRSLNTFELFNLFKVCGAVVKNINSDLPMDLETKAFIAKCIGFYCTDCDSLILRYEEPEQEFLRQAVQNMRSLQTLELLDSSIADLDLHYVPNPSSLRNLTVNNNENIQGFLLKRFTNLRRLSLRNCSINPILLKEALREMPYLTLLDVWECDIDNACFQMITTNIEILYFTFKPTITYADFQNFPRLKSLSFNFSPFYISDKNFPHELFINLARKKHIFTLRILVSNSLQSSCISWIAHINSLRKLIIPNQDQLTDPLLWRLANLPHLEVLNISKCNKFSNLGLATFCEQCTKLKRLNISHCYSINSIFINILLKTLQTKKASHKPKLIIFAKHSGIKKSYISMSTRLRRFKHMVTVRCFHTSVDWHTTTFLNDDNQSPESHLQNRNNCSVCDNAVL